MPEAFKLGPDEFQEWAESRSTQWVRERLRQVATEERQRAEADLFNLSSASPEAWARDQPAAAYLKGRFEALIAIADLDYDYIAEQEPEKEA